MGKYHWSNRFRYGTSLLSAVTGVGTRSCRTKSFHLRDFSLLPSLPFDLPYQSSQCDILKRFNCLASAPFWCISIHSLGYDDQDWTQNSKCGLTSTGCFCLDVTGIIKNKGISLGREERGLRGIWGVIYFAERLVDIWKMLPEEVMKVIIAMFMRFLDRDK